MIFVYAYLIGVFIAASFITYKGGIPMIRPDWDVFLGLCIFWPIIAVLYVIVNVISKILFVLFIPISWYFRTIDKWGVARRKKKSSITKG